MALVVPLLFLLSVVASLISVDNGQDVCRRNENQSCRKPKSCSLKVKCESGSVCCDGLCVSENGEANCSDTIAM